MIRTFTLLFAALLGTCALAPSCSSGEATQGPPEAGKTVTISNLEPRRTTDGNIVDAHDGRVIEFGGTYYWYGTQYGKTNGFTKANEYHVYRSDDLVTWEHLGPALIDPPSGVYYRPHVIFHEASGQYVFWYNWYPELWDGHFGVAVSDSPGGPFTIQNPDVKVAHSELGVGDFGLFVDDDQTAYISYNTIQGHRVSVEKLNPDYTSSSLENGGYIAQYCEAGSMFKRKDIYYLLTDYTCCFCNQGAGARVYVADDPLGEWTLTNNINRLPGRRAHKLTDGTYFTTDYTALNRIDSTFESLILDVPDEGDRLTLHHFTGDRSGQCGQVDNPQVHQLIELPGFSVEFYDHGWRPAGELAPEVTQKNMLQVLEFDVSSLAGKRIRMRPRSDFPYAVRLTEIIGSEGEIYVSNDRPGPVIIPAQQTYVMSLQTEGKTEFIWMGDLWGSASDNVKGHDFQYWSSPLQFDSLGWIAPLSLEEEWRTTLP
ncbi:family 43 glycosylhydrolase [Lewinella sp. W8]|uniref:family 43 glycosylhydrolase n=1 Tax=Lewinella sp. W8 TaxID=2528208 RepID=UPI0010676D82|nr:family 43 glycosylhydrolase [Lewinella sp. W8]MTB50363.1 family 43 glycosylhydrolase [Lewinella sp. W8]